MTDMSLEKIVVIHFFTKKGVTISLRHDETKSTMTARDCAANNGIFRLDRCNCLCIIGIEGRTKRTVARCEPQPLMLGTMAFRLRLTKLDAAQSFVDWNDLFELRQRVPVDHEVVLSLCSSAFRIHLHLRPNLKFKRKLSPNANSKPDRNYFRRLCSPTW